MSVSGVNSTNASAAAYSSSTANSAAKNDAETTANANVEQQDTYEKGTETAKNSGVYTRDTATLGKLSAGQNAYIQNLRNVVNQLVNQIGKNGQANGENNFPGRLQSGVAPNEVESYWDLLVDNGDGTFSLDPTLSPEAQEALIAKAKEDIGENGYYGVDQTSSRILDFAKAITGGDPSKIEDMRKMAQEAFDSVKELMGGKLPDISQQTYDAVMKGFDEWAAEAAAGAVN